MKPGWGAVISQAQLIAVAGGNARSRFEKRGVRRISGSGCIHQTPRRTPLAAVTAEVCFPSSEKEIKGLLLQALFAEQNNLS